jgi:hypothetical protein
MSTTPVLDATGLTVLRTADVLDNMIEAVEGAPQFGPETQTGPDSVVGQILASPSQELGLAYELLQAIYDAGDPAGAEGVVLDEIADARGLTREAATASTATLTLTGTPATVIAAGKRARVPGGGIFSTDAEATIPGGGSIDVEATCTETGPIEAGIGTIETIVDAVAGWTGVTNAAAAEIGTDEETDPALRQRIRDSRSIVGNCTVPAIRARVQALSTVDECICLTNRTLITDADGLPGKSFRVIVWPNTLSTAEEDELVETIWRAGIPAGIYCDGAEERTVTDAQGNSETVRWSYATEKGTKWHILIYQDTDPAVPGYPIDGDDLVKAAVVAYGASLGVGHDVIPIRASAYIVGGYTDSDGVAHEGVTGIRTIIVRVKLGGAPGGGDIVPITISATEISTTDLVNVQVSS